MVWTHEAKEDLREIILYIRDHEPQGRARLILRRLRARGASLASAPHRGRWIPELEREFGVRTYSELVEGPWRLMYRIEEGQVLVVRVLDGRRNVEDILLRSLLDPVPVLDPRGQVGCHAASLSARIRSRTVRTSGGGRRTRV